MVRVRLYTENKKEIRAFLLKAFEAATIFYGRGVWQGAEEDALVLEVLGDEKIYEKILLVAKDIVEQFGQASVLVSREDVYATLIS